MSPAMARVGSSSVFTWRERPRPHTHTTHYPSTHSVSQHSRHTHTYLGEDIDQVVVEVWVLVESLQFLREGNGSSNSLTPSTNTNLTHTLTTLTRPLNQLTSPGVPGYPLTGFRSCWVLVSGLWLSFNRIIICCRELASGCQERAMATPSLARLSLFAPRDRTGHV